MELKYTSDGKKVAVIGKLNAQETIVQEIFVINEQEIPSGENFVTKSLHDSLAVSWKEKEEKKIEENIKKLTLKHDTAVKEFMRTEDMLKNRTLALNEHMAYLKKVFLSDKDLSIFQTLIDFMAGEIKFVVYESYTLEIYSFHDAISYTTRHYDWQKFEALKLMSLFGHDDGSFSFRINDYYEGSGSWTKAHPFKDFESAKECLKQIIIKKGITDQHLKTAAKYEIELPIELLQTFDQTKKEAIQKQIDSYNKEIERLNQQL